MSTTAVRQKSRPIKQVSSLREDRIAAKRDLDDDYVGVMKVKAVQAQIRDNQLIAQQHRLDQGIEDSVDYEEAIREKLNTCQYVMYVLNFTFCLFQSSSDFIKTQKSAKVADRARTHAEKIAKSAQDKREQIEQCQNLMRRLGEECIKEKRNGRFDAVANYKAKIKTIKEAMEIHKALLGTLTQAHEYEKNMYLAMNQVSVQSNIDTNTREVEREMSPYLTTNVGEQVQSKMGKTTFARNIKAAMTPTQIVIPTMPVNKDDKEVDEFLALLEKGVVEVSANSDDEEEPANLAELPL